MAQVLCVVHPAGWLLQPHREFGRRIHNRRGPSSATKEFARDRKYTGSAIAPSRLAKLIAQAVRCWRGVI